MFKRKKNNCCPDAEEKISVTPKSDGVKSGKIFSRQKYQKIIVNKVFNEAQEALEVTEVLLKSVEEINSGMQKHNRQMNKTMEVSSEVGAFSEEVNASVENTISVIEETIDKAQNGQKSVQNVIESINSLKSTIEGMKGALAQMADKSAEIKDIVDTIKTISKTTNLLSLNANIEAARAGDAGRGFGVVAGEVKKLAESSSKSAEELDNIILDITNVTSKTLEIINLGIDKVSCSTKVAQNAGQAIDDMMVSVGKTKQISNEINKAVKEQADKNQYMVSVIDEMSEVADNIRSADENITINAARQVAALNTLSDTINNLNDLSKFEDSTYKSDKTLFTMAVSDIKTFDPAMVSDIGASNILIPINACLVQFGSGMEVIGAISKSWHLENDNVTWNFNLRHDMKFHNGRKIMASDVKYSYERLLSKELNSPNQWFLSMIKGAYEYSKGLTKNVDGIIVTGDYSIKFVLKYPYSAFVNNLAHLSCSILPKEEISSIASNPIGAGAFRFVRKDDTKKEIVLEKILDYALGEALTDEVIMKYDDNIVIDDFINKKLDYMTVNARNIQKAVEKGYTPQTTECAGTRFLPFNFRSNNPLVKSKEARQAINYCIDKKSIIKNAFGSLETPLKGVFPASILNNPDVKGYERDVNKAKALLSKSGVKHNTLTIQIIKSDTNKKNYNNTIAEIVSSNLKDIGIDLKIIETQSKDYYNEDVLSKSDIFIYGWVGDSGTADNFIEPLIDINNASNRGRYNNPELMKLLEKAKKERNPYIQHEILCSLEKKIIEDAPWVFLSNICTTYVCQDNIKGIKVHPLNILNLSNIWKD